MIGMRDCPFCRNDPYHYEDNGCGMEAVAVNCCEPMMDMQSRSNSPGAVLMRKKLVQYLDFRSSHSPRKKSWAARLFKEVVSPN